MKIKKLQFMLLMWIAVLSLFVFINKTSGKNLPSLLPEFNMHEKEITDAFDSCIFSYGPYRDVNEGRYIVAIHYSSKQADNGYDITINGGETILKEGILNEQSTWAVKTVTVTQKDKLEVRTMYHGTGQLSLKSIYIFSITQISVLFFLLVSACVVLIFSKSKKIKSIVTNENMIILFWVALVGCVSTFTFLGSIISLYCGIIHYFLHDRLTKGRFANSWVVFINLISLILLEVLNREFYGFLPLRTSVFSLLLLMEVNIVIFLLIRNYVVRNIVYVSVNVIVLIYGTAQYIYYSFFGSFFRLNSILLARTAMGASRSLLELFVRYEAICYFANLLLYIIALFFFSICKEGKLKNGEKY